MKKTVLFLIIFVIVKLQAQNYQISFAGTGASSTVDSVKVENLTQCKSILLNGSDILNLNVTNGINEISNSTDNTLHVYPNPMTDYCLVDFEATAQGEANIKLFDIAGKRITEVQEFLSKGHYTYKLDGIGSGIYVLKVESKTYSYSTKIVSCIADCGMSIAELKHIEAVPASSFQPPASNKGTVKSLKGNKSLINWQYTKGDTLKLTGISDIYRTVFMLAPAKSDSTVTFNFIACTDKDKNNYSIVQIGTQTWIEENLKTTKYNDGTVIPNVTDNTTWMYLGTPGYCWYDNSISFKKNYGAMYNWFAVNTGKLCPTGWHVPSIAEWNTLINYLGGSNIAGGKMKETCLTYWQSPNIRATNSSGFTGLPAGERGYDGDFGYMGSYVYWWSTTAENSWYYYNCSLDNLDSNASEYAPVPQCGSSVRCIKD